MDTLFAEHRKQTEHMLGDVASPPLARERRRRSTAHECRSNAAAKKRKETRTNPSAPVIFSYININEQHTRRAIVTCALCLKC